MVPVTDFKSYQGNQGYVFDQNAIDAFCSQMANPLVMQAAPFIRDAGKGKDFFLFEIERALTGGVRPPHNQTIGDCVSQGITGSAEDLQFVLMKKNRLMQFKPLSSEATYGIARIQVGRGGCGFGDGAVVAWGIEGSQKFGFLARGKYGDIDLTNYRADLAKKWGRPGAGTPAELAELCKEHPLQDANLIEASSGGPSVYEQARDVLASGGVIVTGSNQLYSNTRDKQGFCSRADHGGHCTYYRGFTDNSSRPGIVYQQSWGSGMPTGGEMTVTLPSGQIITLPPGAFFIDADDFDRMHTGGGNEVWGMTSEIGFLTPDELVDFHSYQL